MWDLNIDYLESVDKWSICFIHWHWFFDIWFKVLDLLAQKIPIHHQHVSMYMFHVNNVKGREEDIKWVLKS